MDITPITTTTGAALVFTLAELRQLYLDLDRPNQQRTCASRDLCELIHELLGDEE